MSGPVEITYLLQSFIYYCIYLSIYSVYVYTCVNTRVTGRVCGSQVTACGGQLSPSTMWDLEIGVRSLYLVARWPHLLRRLRSSFEFSHLLNDLGEVICKMGVTSQAGVECPACH